MDGDKVPVRRFRSAEEMPDARCYEPGDPRLRDAIDRVWRLGTETLQPRFPPGVHKYRSIEEADAAREEWARRNFGAYRARMRRAAGSSARDQGPAPTDDRR